jgi:hypothetical protein
MMHQVIAMATIPSRRSAAHPYDRDRSYGRLFGQRCFADCRRWREPIGRRPISGALRRAAGAAVRADNTGS